MRAVTDLDKENNMPDFTLPSPQFDEAGNLQVPFALIVDRLQRIVGEQALQIASLQMSVEMLTAEVIRVRAQEFHTQEASVRAGSNGEAEHEHAG
jgi:hypothetical protein